MFRSRTLWFAACALLVTVAGCSNKSEPLASADAPAAAPKGLSSAEAEKRIQDIQNNASMPDVAKQSAIAGIRNAQKSPGSGAATGTQ